MKKRILAAILSTAMIATMVSGCSISTESTTEPGNTAENAGNGETPAKAESGDLKNREVISLWFWGAEPYAQEAMQKILADKYNASQDKYILALEFRPSVDTDMSTALAANQGPDIVYGSGPSFVMPLVEAGKLEPLDPYAEQYGWKDRLLQPFYDSGTVGGKLYSLTSGVSTVGVFYNKKVLADNGWEVPKSIQDMEKVMDHALEKGMYASVTGNKGWKPVNENYASLFLTHIAGPETVYKCLMGEEKWNNQEMQAAINKSKEWWDKGYLAGKDYVNLNFSESLQILADEKSPFFIGPSIAFQWAASFFTGDKAENIAFMPFPATEEVPNETYTLGASCTLSINANVSKEHKDEAAKIIDMMMQPEFMKEMTAAWPGYWGTPLKDLSAVDTTGMGYLSKSFVDVVKNVSDAVNKGNFGYYDNVFFPAATQQNMVNIEDVWYNTISSSDYLDKVDKDFSSELAKGLVPPIPAPAMNK
ncbi:ABC transporter substrate-binding protein [Lacrimispora sp.]|uniref:ABC transporter substrate-binding protein n=1 Tax=Lacrimispora sp. TaxID=2719234 RepID=UPI0028606660|nr:extracellular solute-binding protein [Lacrimispora sp.]MDR7811853.1 extracellular solute-binding protein [Lacrimispora sp.]